jgi:hypothetical protein
MLKMSDDIRCVAVGPSQNLYLQGPYKSRDNTHIHALSVTRLHHSSISDAWDRT